MFADDGNSNHTEWENEMKRLMTASLTMVAISCCCTQSANASKWSDWKKWAEAAKEAETDYVSVLNNTGRIVKFRIKKGDGTTLGTTAPVYPGEIAWPIG